MAGIVSQKEALELSGYVGSLSSRLRALERTAGEMSDRIDRFIADVHNRKEGILGKQDIIKQEVTGIKDEVGHVQKAILRMIDELKHSVKADEFERFKKRIDLWAPESMVTRNEVEKVIEDL